MIRANLVYEDRPRYDLWLKAVLGGVLALTLVLGFIFLGVDIAASAVMFGITAFDALLFYFILPRSYGIYADRLVIRMGGPFTVKIPLSDITSARQAPVSSAFAYNGLRLSTSIKNLMEITRRRGINVVISPSNRDLFLEQLNQSIKSVSSSGTGHII